MIQRVVVGVMVALALFVVIWWFTPGESAQASGTSFLKLGGLVATVRVVRDSDGVPHIFAKNDHDAALVFGYVQAQDRLFQMDTSRRTFSGTLAELLGDSVLASDIELRTLGLRRAAEESWKVYSARGRSWLQAFADGVNAYLADPNLELPAEYAALELTQVEPWTAIDSLAVAKGVSFGLSFDSDIGRTLSLRAYEAAGQGQGFNGTDLFFQDLFRSAPFDPALSIPEFFAEGTTTRSSSGIEKSSEKTLVQQAIRPETLVLASRYRERVRRVPWLDRIFDGNRSGWGSNWWVVSGAVTESGNPMLANDPHLALNTPATLYEAHLVVSEDPTYGPTDIGGVGFAGTPFLSLGCNKRICWGATVNPMDVTDTFEEELVIDLFRQLPTHTIFDGQQEAVVMIPQTFHVNQVSNGVPDDLEEASVGNLAGGLTFLVPRRNMGPLVAVDLTEFPKVTALSVQFAGFSATREGEAFLEWAQASGLEEFQKGLQHFDVGSQNWAYADVDGNIAYFAGGEMPLREDLEAGRVDGLAPFFIRSGTHQFKNEWIPLETPPPNQAMKFQILPFEEMPQVVNPDQGFIFSANNDPVGTTLDNNVFSRMRASGGIYYLNPGYTSVRAGRIRELIRERLADGGKLSLQEMKQLQSDHQLLDARIFIPTIVGAFGRAQAEGAPQILADLAASAGVVEAVGRLGAWDFTTPTGLREGYDPGDDPANLVDPGEEEIRNSVAAALYSAWRGQILANVVDATLTRLGLGTFPPDSERSLSALRNLLEEFPTKQGVGASGVNFFQVDGIASAPVARDFLILRSLRDALDLLASDSFASAFGNSTNQEDYRWGRLHRIIFDHRLGSSFSIPGVGEFADLSAELPGLARSGGYETVDASAHSARAATVNGFMFGSGPSRRFVAELKPAGIKACQILPGGQSGLINSQFHHDQLGRWLTNQYHPLRLSEVEILVDAFRSDIFTPAILRRYFPFYQGDADTFTAIAVSNLASSPARLEFSAWTAAGELESFPLNPRMIDLGSGRQEALLGSEIFGVDQSALHTGWVELTAAPDGEPNTSDPILGSFTQFGSFDLTRMDGAVAFHDQARRLILTRVYEGPSAFQGQAATTFLSLANPNDMDVDFTLTYIPPEDGPVPSLLRREGPVFQKALTLVGKGVLFGSLTQIFPEILPASGGYLDVEVTQGGGLVGFELVRLDQRGTLFGLNASFAPGALESFSAQLASSANIFTSTKLVNTGDALRRVTLTPVGADGTDLADTVTLMLDPAQSLEGLVSELFDFSSQASQDVGRQGVHPAGSLSLQEDGEVVEGSLRVVADGDGIVGDVVFGDPLGFTYAAALPLQSRPFIYALFNHVATVEGFFTGLALYNPGADSAEIRVQVFSDDGSQSGDTMMTLGAGARTSKLVRQLDPATIGQTGGFIRITSSQPLVAQQLFGTSSLSLLSAVPPTVLR